MTNGFASGSLLGISSRAVRFPPEDGAKETVSVAFPPGWIEETTNEPAVKSDECVPYLVRDRFRRKPLPRFRIEKEAETGEPPTRAFPMEKTVVLLEMDAPVESSMAILDAGSLGLVGLEPRAYSSAFESPSPSESAVDDAFAVDPKY